jgi:hypothetical protein
MGYSRNPELVEVEMPNLLELKAGRSCRWTTAPNWPATSSLLRRLRQALYIANLYPERFPELALASKNFALHLVGPGIIEAKPKQTATVETDLHAIARVQGGPVWGKEVSTVGKTTADEIVTAWAEHQPSNDPLNFQQTKLSPEELSKLYHWAKNGNNHPELMLLVGEGFLTVALVERGAPEWSPPAGLTSIKKETKYDIDPD